jgi:plasmid stability protein
MASITVKNIPSDLYEQLKESAVANHRSLNGEIIACIERRWEARGSIRKRFWHRLASCEKRSGGHRLLTPS